MTETSRALATLKAKGYYVGNLWHLDDVYVNHDCTEQEAYDILDSVLNSDSTIEYINHLIASEISERLKIK